MGKVTHGGADTRLYTTWRNMIARCHDEDKAGYEGYGAKGITVSPEWRSFLAFRDWAEANGYQDNLTIDRRNNSLGYNPDNCRWLTPRQNARNRTTNHLLTAFGETKSVIEWVEDERCQVSYPGLQHRLRAGWSVEEAIAAPKQPGRRRDKG